MDDTPSNRFRRTVPARRRWLLSAALVLAAPACSSSHSATTGNGAGASTATAAPSPLKKALGIDSDVYRSAMRLNAVAEQQLIVSCMHDAGWTYLPLQPAATATGFGGTDLPRDVYVSRYGFGISLAAPAAAHPVDPNEKFVAGLDQTAHSRYSLALYGSDDGSQLGCERSAAMNAPQRLATQPVIAQVNRALDDLQAQIDADSRVAAANGVYGSCMSSHGYAGIAGQADSFNTVQQAYAGYLALPTTPTNDAERATALKRVQTLEIAVAGADLSCSPPLEQVEATVRNELEQQFVEQHATEIQQYRALLSGALPAPANTVP